METILLAHCYDDGGYRDLILYIISCVSGASPALTAIETLPRGIHRNAHGKRSNIAAHSTHSQSTFVFHASGTGRVHSEVLAVVIC